MDIFSIKTEEQFVEACLNTFHFQLQHNRVYRQFVELSGANANPSSIEDIPFLPIEFFKNHQVVSGDFKPEFEFTSSSTSGQGVSTHYVRDVQLYRDSFFKAINHFYGDPKDLLILALLPSYLERQGSSLVYMAEALIEHSAFEESGFYLADFEALADRLDWAQAHKYPTLFLGVTFALLDFAETFSRPLGNTIVMETGGMKGRKKELTRAEVHQQLKAAFSVDFVHSEYGMTELLSQAYSLGNGIFECPPWMRVITRSTTDPFQFIQHHKTGGMNIIDLANQHSCSFIATQDLGKTLNSHQFEVLGRFDHSDVRGCNLMAL